MSENPYALPVEEFLDRSRVPVADQVETQTGSAAPEGGWGSGLDPYLDGGGGDADGD
ncbi:hypothetical protein GCU60_13400 [Blastococcus saxobsidens]|uniref:Uncharacterized protein n=1 Tax=Blastococcus saxobsidens TaxID=138336 RepID=A0A6L9W5M4_9ACTN|nr:hypothetical protein [Blastococcus saxobsidens]NEK86741.1 hypothetical protein [Blastococcus saxobsidens]